MEKSIFVDQKRRIVRQVLAEHRALFSAQGSVQCSWRYYQGRRLGPFYRLTYRVAGRQMSFYLGENFGLAAEVEQTLRDLQAERRELRVLERQQAVLRRAFRAHKRNVDRELQKTGGYLKGNEIRGRRTAFRRA